MLRYILLLIFFAYVSTSARAQSNGPLGLGVILGDPTGVSIKSWKNSRNAFDGGLAWSLNGANALQIHGDYLWHRYDLTGYSRTPMYFGVGARLRFTGNNTGLGVRFPIGILHLIREAPFELFLEIVPVFTLSPATAVDMDGGMGVRFYF